MCDLALEAATAISKLPTSDRDMYRQLVAEHISAIKQNTNSKHNTHPEERNTETIQAKLRINDAEVTRAGKGNSIVFLPTQQYNSKLQLCIQANNFNTTNTDLTKNFQSQIRKTNGSKVLIPQEEMEIC